MRDRGAPPAQMARWASALFAAGGAGGLLVVAVPHWARFDIALVLIVSGAALAIGGVLALVGDRLPTASFPWVAATGSAAICLAVYGSGPRGEASAIFFALVGLYVGAMFTTRVIVLELGFIAASYAGCLAAQHAPGAPATWISAVLVTSIVGTVTAAITRANRYAALRDSLTGLPNRRALDDTLSILTAAAHRRGFPLSVAILDLDEFKEVNSNLGHQGADELLVDLVARWRKLLRPEDLLARYGGDEFVVLLPDTNLDTALGVVTRLMHANRPGETFSAGVATWDQAELSSALLCRADSALFEAKDRGRDRVIAAGPPADPAGLGSPS